VRADPDAAPQRKGAHSPLEVTVNANKARNGIWLQAAFAI
jgi:hypothetical protein